MFLYVCFGQKECVAVYEHHIDLVSFNLKHPHKSERNFENLKVTSITFVLSPVGLRARLPPDIWSAATWSFLVRILTLPSEIDHWVRPNMLAITAVGQGQRMSGLWFPSLSLFMCECLSGFHSL